MLDSSDTTKANHQIQQQFEPLQFEKYLKTYLAL